MKKNSLILASASIFLASCASDPTQMADFGNNPQRTALDMKVHEAYRQNSSGLNSVGVSVGIYKDGQVSYYGYGETKKGNQIPPDADTYFEIGSVTKTYTAIAITKMLHEKGLSIETPIRSFLPGNLPTLQRAGVELTFKHLLSHTSGLPYFPNNMGLSLYTNVSKSFRKYDDNKLYTCLKNVQLEFVPFTVWEYSNTAFGVLGNILERNYGKSYADVIKEKVTVPLGLVETIIDMKEVGADKFCTGYQNGKEVEYWNTLNSLDAAGVLKSNTRDLLKYGIANLTPPDNELGAAIRKSHELVYSKIVDRERFQLKPCSGWFLYSMSGVDGEFLFHNGGTGGFNTELFVNKKNNSALVILYNTDGFTDGRTEFTRELLRILIE